LIRELLMEKNSKDNARKCQKVYRIPSTHDEREDKSERNHPKILSGTIKLPQVFGYMGSTKEMGRMSYNFKYAVSELCGDRNLDKHEGNDALFMNVIRRPRVYTKIEGMAAPSKTPTVETALDRDLAKPDLGSQKRERHSKSCPKPVNLDKQIPRYSRVTQAAWRSLARRPQATVVHQGEGWHTKYA
jgi:hypothetical protein